jgi:nucleotide-binding universal stress UspA family protein
MKVLLAIDGSSCSDAAVKKVAEWPWQPHTEVRVIMVDAPVDQGLFGSVGTNAFDEIVKQQRAEATKRLTEATNQLTQRAPHLLVTSALIEGSPKDAIVTEAERFGADLVVVGSHGYGPIRRFFLGSVSLFVAHHAPCSVMIVRPPPEIASTTPASPSA